MIINLMNLTMVFSLILLNFINNKYLLFILIMVFGTLAAQLKEKIFIKCLKKESPLFKSKFSKILIMAINVITLIYFFLVKEYTIAIMFVTYMVLHVCIIRFINLKNKIKTK